MVKGLADTFFYLSRVAEVKTVEEISAFVFHEISRFGFAGVAMAWSPQEEAGKTSWQSVGFPHDYLQHYAARNYERHSPLVRRLGAASEPFCWHETDVNRRADPLGYQVMAEAHEAGLRHGWSVPIHEGPKLSGWVSVRADHELKAIPDLPVLQLVTLWAHHHARRVLRQTPAMHGVLTPRERDVLRWSACGKTSDEIADILNLGARTVEHHFTNAANKLGTVNRTHTVVEAIRLREIEL